MTEHEKSRKHYEQSGTYDPNMEYFEECEVNSGAWVLITRQIPVDERCKPHLFGIYWGIPKQDRFDRQVCVVHTTEDVTLLNHEFTVIDDERLKVYREEDMNDTIQILELFGGIGSPRCALRNLNIPTKAIDYVEINEKAVQSYNSMFREELEYKTQTVVGWNLKPDILIHGSPCQDMSIAGHQGKATGDGRINRGKGSDEGSGTRSSLMWETIHIIENMGEWRPRYVIWENVKNVKSKYMRPNFDRYMVEMEKLGYTNNYAVLDAREFGLPQARERVFTISVLNGEKFEFDDLIRTPMRNLQEFLEDDVPDIYDVTQPSVLACIGEKGIRRATVIKDCAYTITTRQDRTPAQVIDRGDGRYRYLTERECWRLMGYSDEDFDRAKAVQERNGKYYKALYDQAGNSIAVPIFESIFRKIILQEVA